MDVMDYGAAYDEQVFDQYRNRLLPLADSDTAVAQALDTIDAMFDDLDNGHITAALRQRRLVDPPAWVAFVGILFDEPWSLIWTDEPSGHPHVLYLGPGLP
jgi:hypothetical protein